MPIRLIQSRRATNTALFAGKKTNIRKIVVGLAAQIFWNKIKSSFTGGGYPPVFCLAKIKIYAIMKSQTRNVGGICYEADEGTA